MKTAPTSSSSIPSQNGGHSVVQSSGEDSKTAGSSQSKPIPASHGLKAAGKAGSNWSDIEMKKDDKVHKIDSSKLLAEISKNSSNTLPVDKNDENIGQTEKIKGAVATSAGSVLTCAGGIVVWFWPIGTIVGAALLGTGIAMTAIGGSKSAKSQEIKALAEQKSAEEGAFWSDHGGADRANLINQQLEQESKSSAQSSAAMATVEHGSTKS